MIYVCFVEILPNDVDRKRGQVGGVDDVIVIIIVVIIIIIFVRIVVTEDVDGSKQLEILGGIGQRPVEVEGVGVVEAFNNLVRIPTGGKSFFYFDISNKLPFSVFLDFFIENVAMPDNFGSSSVVDDATIGHAQVCAKNGMNITIKDRANTSDVVDCATVYMATFGIFIIEKRILASAGIVPEIVYFCIVVFLEFTNMLHHVYRELNHAHGGIISTCSCYK